MVFKYSIYTFIHNFTLNIRNEIDDNEKYVANIEDNKCNEI